jgi:hypothetical protein
MHLLAECAFAGIMGLLLVAPALAQEPRVLFDFAKSADLTSIAATDAKVSQAKAALRVDTGHTNDWPGITLKAPGGTWDLGKFAYVEVQLKNVGANDVTVCCRVDNTGADGIDNCVTDSLALKPGDEETLKVVFRRRPAELPGVKLFGMRGYPINQEGKGTIDPSRVTGLVIFVAKPSADHAFEIRMISAGGEYTPPKADALDPKKFFPFIDVFGQYIHRDWPGKVHSVEDLAKNREQEEKDLAARPGPASWDKWGGWRDGPTLKATGFFRTEKHEGRWWLVDPDGKLFWSHGIDCVNDYGETPIEDRLNWYQGLPETDPDLKAFFGKAWALHGYYKGRTMRCFDFTRANLRRKYGPDWQKTSADLAHKRLRSWGLNTIANWSDPAVYGMDRTAYTATVGFNSKLIEGSEGYWGKFKDPFDPEFEANMKEAMAKEVARSAKDPWCLGYFVDNEIAWEDDTSLAVAALKSPADQACKKALLADLKTKYGEISKLNAAWGTSHESWEALTASKAAPDKKKAEADLHAFYTRTAEQYFRVIRDAAKAAAPNHLYLGCRFAWVNDLAAQASAKFCDVVSYNFYRREVESFRFPGGADVPLIIGEFHFGALDRGMFHTGLVPVADQKERGHAYEEYVRGALRHRQFVGTGWFQYRDEPTTGRPYDEENYQIGFVDNCDTPYPETIHAAIEVGSDLYNFRAKLK